MRLLALVDPALATLARAVKSKRPPTAVEISAAKDILDRAGLGAKEAENTAAPTIQLVVVQAGAQDRLGDGAGEVVDIRSLIRE